ncbi:MAG: hypothetical protein JW384_03899 [Nitrosomonadaceae bacterium]|nr:hypothetical protein [Nitrosomonadaceae bacterium]
MFQHIISEIASKTHRHSIHRAEQTTLSNFAEIMLLRAGQWDFLGEDHLGIH